MATPKTPRRRANKAQEAASTEAVVENNAGVTDAEIIADARDEGSTEDAAVVLDEPAIADDPAPLPPPEEASEQPTEQASEQREPDHRPEERAPAKAVAKSGPGFVPLVLGGVVAAAIGFGLAQFAPEGWPLPGASPLQVQLTDQAAEIATLRAQLEAIPLPDTSAMTTELEQIRATAANALEVAQQAATAAPEAGPDMAPEIDALTSRLAALEQRPTPTATANPAALEALRADIATLRSGLEAQKANADSLVEAAEIARAAAAAEAQTVLLQASLTKVEAAMQNGLPFVAELAALADAGVTVPETLTNNAEAGLPTLATLSEGFDAPARAALKESLRGDMGSTWGERFGSFMRSQTGARSLTPQEGDDPDAVLSRADAAVAAGDLQTALTEIAALPDAAQAALADWVAQVKLRNDAQAATAELSAALSER